VIVGKEICKIANWESIVLLYDNLVDIAPTVGALIGRAAALTEAHGAEAGITALEEIEPRLARTYQPYWAVRGDLLSRLDRRTEAYAAYTQAIGLAENNAVRSFLQKRRSILGVN
jgi:RNA polymerase sigma-70 factor (ECF subfamily)